MTYYDKRMEDLPTGFGKVLAYNWALTLLIIAASSIGFLMLVSVANGDIHRWAQPQMIRFALGMTLMTIMAFIPISTYRSLSLFVYLFALGLLVMVEFFGDSSKGAQRWIDLGFMRLQPSEVMKIALVMMLALYYSWLDQKKVSKLRWVLPPLILTFIPMALVLRQPDLGTALTYVPILVAIVIAAGARLKHMTLAGLGALSMAPLAWLFVLRDYRSNMARPVEVVPLADDNTDLTGIRGCLQLVDVEYALPAKHGAMVFKPVV